VHKILPSAEVITLVDSSLCVHYSRLRPNQTLVSLKVHKIEIFFGFDFEICNISLLVMSKYYDFAKKNFDWASIGGGATFPRSLKTTRNDKKF
jgi:hypothetical protein